MNRLEIATVLLSIAAGALLMVYAGLCWRRNSEALREL